MPRKLEAYQEEILLAIDDIRMFVADLDFDGYQKDVRTKSAVERKLLVIGEALSQASRVSSKINDQVSDYRKIVAFRNILVHGYFGVDDTLVWDVVSSKLERLRQEIKAL